MSQKVRKFVSREFANTVDLDLLARFLAPFADDIGFDWNNLPEDDRERRDAIFEFFRGADDRFPAELQNALHCARVLSNDNGSRLLREQADLRGVSLVDDDEALGEADGRHLTPRHLALRAYLDHRDIFYRAVDIAALWSVSSPLERSGANEGIACPHDEEAAREAFRSAASEYFASRYNGRYCDVRWYPDDEEIGILVLHGKSPRVANVEDGGRESTLSYREIAEDTIRYHAASGRVKIGSANKTDAQKLLELFATHLIGDVDFFAGDGSDRLYTLAPIRQQGAAFRFRYEWDDDVASVRVREIQVDEGEHEVNGRVRFSPWAMTVRDSENAVRRLAELAPDIDFADLRLNYVKLEFRFDMDGRESRVTVKIKPNNIASFRDHTNEAKIMELLERNGLRIVRRAQ